LASAGLASATFTSASSGGNNDWQHETLLFSASSASTTISLVGSTGQIYIGLDNVSVIAVPEPEEWAMMLLGLRLGRLSGQA
jgi:hypothetical protein